jgi:cellulose synthase/poly-beta-1,6-N-acetylglucosamine synthase-like glycosyltransferase
MTWTLSFLFSFIVFFFSLIFFIIGINARRQKYKPDFFPNVSVISWFWKDGNIIERKIKNFLSLKYPGKYEIIIVDNASDDETKQICEKYAKRGLIKYYRTKVPYDRKAYGLDEAIKKVAKYDVLAMTDPDGFCDKNWLIKLVQPFKEKKIGAVIGLTHCGNFYKNFFTKLRAVEDEWIYVMSPLGRSFGKDVQFICGANYAVRRKALKSVGYHGKKTLCEDIELSVELHKKGWEIKVIDGEVWQEEVGNVREYIRQRLRWQNSTMEFFKFYSKDIIKTFKNRPIGLFLLLTATAMQIFSFLSLIPIIWGYFFSLNVFLLGLFSFIIFNITFIPGLIRFKKTYLLPYVPFFLTIDSILLIYCQIVLRYLKFMNKKIVWRSLHDGYYHNGEKMVLK